MNNRNNVKFNELFKNTISQKDYNCVFTFNFYPSIARNCNSFHIKYISWVYDSPLVALYSYTITFPYNYVFISDNVEYLKLKNSCIQTDYYAPLAVNIHRLERLPKNKELLEKYSSELSFVGSMYNESHDLFDRLKNLSPFTSRYLKGIMEAQQKIFGYYFIEELLTENILEELTQSLEYKPNADGAETSSYIYANYFIGRKITSMERLHLLSVVSKQFQVKVYTNNPTPEFKHVINIGKVDYYEQMPYIFKSSKINLNIPLRSIQNGIPLRAFDIMGSDGFLLSN